MIRPSIQARHALTRLTLPVMVIAAFGLMLVGKVDTTKQKGLRTTFEVVPDAPVEKFLLQMKGGKRYSLLENSENLCAKPQTANTRFLAQNGRASQQQSTLAVQCKSKKKSGRNKHGNLRTARR